MFSYVILILIRIAQALYANQQFTIDEMHNYRMAVTEREVSGLNNCNFDSQIDGADFAGIPY